MRAQHLERRLLHPGAVLGNVNKKPFSQNNPTMHCQPRYHQVSSAIPKWLMAVCYFNNLLEPNNVKDVITRHNIMLLWFVKIYDPTFRHSGLVSSSGVILAL